MAQQANDRASTHSIEKDLERVDYIEFNNNKYANIGLTAEETDFYENFPEDKKKKMIRKIDFRLVPVLAVSEYGTTSLRRDHNPAHYKRAIGLLIHRRE
jgi:hypothetical protein